MTMLTQRREPTQAELLDAAYKLAAAVMEARSEVLDGSASLSDLRDDVRDVIREWNYLAWRAHPYLADQAEST